MAKVTKVEQRIEYTSNAVEDVADGCKWVSNKISSFADYLLTKKVSTAHVIEKTIE